MRLEKFEGTFKFPTNQEAVFSAFGTNEIGALISSNVRSISRFPFLLRP